VGFIILDSVSFDVLKSAYLKEVTSFQAVMDFRVVSNWLTLEKDGTRRQLQANSCMD
jgi:hypothetical protein